MIAHIIDGGYAEYLEENFANHRNRSEDLEQLSTFALRFESLEEFLTQLALLTNVEAEAEEKGRDRRDDQRVRLSTVHQAKVLEFDVVFVISLCDGLFPSLRSIQSSNLEEERRLFYVAITRARNELYLSFPAHRVRGGGPAMWPSRFIKGLPAELLDEWNLRRF
jgi:DNA helicase-2/ATP-dependent DNA helicase PcrA